MIFTLVVMTGLEKYYITSAYLHSQCYSGERPVARGPLVFVLFFVVFLYLTVVAICSAERLYQIQVTVIYSRAVLVTLRPECRVKL